jgi:hypothetical protein
MAGSLSDYAENHLLDHILGTTAYTKPTTYIALYTVAPSDSTSGTEVSNSGGSAYARQVASFSAASGGTTSNSGNIDFTDMPACTVVAIGVVDSGTIGAGNLLVWGTLSANKTLDAGDTLRVATGDLDISLD